MCDRIHQLQFSIVQYGRLLSRRITCVDAIPSSGRSPSTNILHWHPSKMKRAAAAAGQATQTTGASIVTYSPLLHHENSAAASLLTTRSRRFFFARSKV